MKYICITGGVMSGLGKGITAASTGRILKDRGFKVTPIKIDPYLNIDAGTMNPYQHGEVFVLKDGGEVDLDLGHYERFLNVELTSDHNITTGKIYRNVIERERRGDYLGETVQIIPHVTNEIKRWIRDVASSSGCEICLIEIGGTVGDIESMPFLEAIRQMRHEEGEENFVLIHVTLVPTDIMGDQKTKPTQHSVKTLRELGLQPDVIVGRCSKKLRDDVKAKISLFTDVPVEAVISAENAEDIYYVPRMLKEERLDEYLIKRLKLEPREDSKKWDEIVEKMERRRGEVKVAIVGKYTFIPDSYLSIREALKHASIELGVNVSIEWVEASEIERGKVKLEDYEFDGILVPGGFGARGSEGKIEAIKYARENEYPFLGICLGFQLAVVEFARNVIGWKDAHTSEIERTSHPVIDLLPEQRGIKKLGGTMRLGEEEITIKEGTLAHRIYRERTIRERHRHRYEVNPRYIEKLEESGLVFSAESRGRMEIAELPSHPFFFATQFHPEFKSRPENPSPPFVAFMEAMMRKRGLK